jgi:para-aminobenzoate synthetase
MVGNGHSILFIDAYDSFTNNIISLLTASLSCSVRVIHIDSPGFESDDALLNELRHYDAVVCGPGPGDPSNEKDVGIMNRLWRLGAEDILPVLGICLGFQSLCLAFGGPMQILSEGLHGRVRRIDHIGEISYAERNNCHQEVFDGVGALRATLYHSLYVVTNQNQMSEDEWQEKKWKGINDSGLLLPLAWAGSEARDKLRWKDDRILMAVRHATKPFWGLQYHPESICTNKEGKTVIQNWFELALKWNAKNGRIILRDESGIRGGLPRLASLLGRVERRRSGRRPSSRDQKARFEQASNFETAGLGCCYKSRTIDLQDRVDVPLLVEHLQRTQRDHILLESTNAHIEGVGAEAVRGRYSIIAFDVDQSLRVEYHARDKFARVHRLTIPGEPVLFDDQINLTSYGGIWSLLAEFLDRRRVIDGIPESPFWGGWMGYTTYELGLEGIDVETNYERVDTRPDLSFAWVTRSLVVDHLLKKIYIQELVEHGTCSWVDEVVSLLESLLNLRKRRNSKSQVDVLGDAGILPLVIMPNNTTYESKVRTCQENIRRGESYELCLTDQTHITLPRQQLPQYRHSSVRSVGRTAMHETHQPSISQTRAWSLYKSLRIRNPAPFASFIRLGSATFVSGSPERFLKWSAKSKCELRPMKGTVKKSSAVSSLAQAEALLQVPKEQAENLMIVDLVRHDLHGVCGSGNVTVSRLMVVEEYATVFQMISIVEGQIPQIPQKRRDSVTQREAEQTSRIKYTGIDVLAASLPPGSMTGAPKKRSCEILQEIEERKDRSLYSGVVGYMDAGGRGDFSVNIRCMFRWDDENLEPVNGIDVADQQDMEMWHIGAGGAVTALSTPVAEREEMQTKLAGTLGIFGKFSGTRSL